ncbi:uncharacterized protein PFL1_03137 [Pseudozyma flocculosa PF-1]|uniref:Cytochrome c domain-containing protein n=2 Tax=Pseudozyma flocculosa TaxID=84751 RepID=A0A5C3F0T8_9BASI|nr:uncharacterized protein PFL1_03137 [Pseudozyma flocculosa PF-1]EPQ29382.1 hypothetical protein PFL1_03137 [Pseudozyma flocculosa PF-1]SPO37902.1 uncharacterized protein PSFLO_03379 [Pseudozyma flocculosa]
MRFATLLPLSLLVAATATTGAPATASSDAVNDEAVQIPLAVPYLTEPRTVTFTVPDSLAHLFDWASDHATSARQAAVQAAAGDEGDICPKMKVSCVKDGKTVGDIGKKPFCRNGVTCGQCHQTENTAECNAKHLAECKAQCEAQGPLGGTAHRIMAEWFA